MEQHNISNAPRPNSPIEGYEGLSKVNDDGGYALSILVEGIYCAACIQKIESALNREEDVQKARLNFSTRRLSIEWVGENARANDYVSIIERLGYRVQPYDPDVEKSETTKEEKFLLLCLGVAGFALGNVMLLSVGVWASSAETMGMATRDLMHWVSALIALPTLLFSGRPFFRSALGSLSKGHTNMDVPISFALMLAGGMSLYETANHGEHVYFDSAVMLMFFLLIGRYLDFRARKQARSSATDLLGSISGFANVIKNEKIQRILVKDIQQEMRVRVSMGEAFPVDGIVAEGASSVDTCLVTGETLPRGIGAGDKVFAGTMNLDAPITIRASKLAEDSLLADIVKLMEKAGQGQAEYVRLADKAARLYTPVVHVFAVLAFLGWWIVGGLVWQEALMIAITVLIITCPCALALAVPVVQVLASGRLMKNGVLVKSGDALERLARIDTVLLDKTGTLTVGRPALEGDVDWRDLQIAASLASHSKHPLSVALVHAFDGERVDVRDVEEIIGKGLKAIYDGKVVKLGSRDFCGDKSIGNHDVIELWLSVENENPVVFHFTDPLRSDAQNTIQSIKGCGLNPIMLSGDRALVAERVGKEAGISKIYAEQTPPQKFEVLDGLKQNGHCVLMVGDGLNDAPVLAGANVSMAPGTAIDMAQNAADIVFMGDGLFPVFDTYKTARMTQTLVKQNFALAIIYNIFAIPLALAGFVTPLIAALAMSGSSLIVIANSFRLKFRS